MITKFDLAKQFELLTLQEIKNYNDSLSLIYQKLQDLQVQITMNQEDNNKKFAQIDSRQQKIESELAQYKERYSYDVKQLYSMHNDAMELGARNAQVMNRITDEVNHKLMFAANIKENISNIHAQIDKDSDHYNAIHKNIYNEIESLRSKIPYEIAKMKKEILDTPSDIHIVKKELEEQLSSYRIDVAGIMRELNIYKKECFIVEKKLEAIFTRLDELKEKNK